jgi:hypothetical protein
VTFAGAVGALAGDPQQAQRLGETGFLYAQVHLDRGAVLEKLEAALLGLVKT